MVRESGIRRRFVTLLAIFTAFLLSPSITSAGDLVFGPVTCQRGTGAPTVFIYSFSVPEPSRGFIFKVYNGGLEDTTYELVSSSTITLNGIQILGPSNFNQNVTSLEAPVSLQAQNTLNVEVHGKPGGAIILKLYPFVVLDSPTKGQIFKAQPVAVSGHLYSTASSVSVNGLPATVSGTNFTAATIPLAEGRNTILVRATRDGGFVGTDSVEVILDSMAPVVTLTYPPEGLITNQTVIPQYSVSDAQDLNPQVTVVPPPPYSAEGNYQMTLTAADWAGNSVAMTRGFLIDKTLPLTSDLSPTPGSAIANSRVSISASYSDALSGIEAASIRLLIDSTDVTSLASISGQSISYHPATALADGSHQITLTVPDRAGNTATANWSFVVDTTPPLITILSPVEGASVATATIDLSGSVNDPTAIVKVNGTGVILTGNTFTVVGLALIPGQNTIVIEAQDALGNGSSVPLHVTYVPPVPTASLTATPSQVQIGGSVVLQWTTSNAVSVSITPNVGTVAANGSVTLSPGSTTTYTLFATGPGGTTTAQTTVTVTQPTGNVRISASSSTIQLGGSTTLSWTATDATGIVINQGIGIVQATGSKVVQPTSTTEYVITAAGTQGASSASVVVTVLGNVQPLPAGSFGANYQDQIPQDATVTAYDAKRFSLVTGTVKARNNQPLADVGVSILLHPEYGTVLTNDDGKFSLPVEGGGVLTVSYKKSGFRSSHRQVEVPWNDITLVETITMIPEDLTTTKVAFNGNPGTVTVHQSTVVTDEFGSRSATIVFTGDNMAYAKVDNKTIQLSTINVRATEFDTPESMPAKLPPTSAYTYCSDLSVDGAQYVQFVKPVTVYVDNFLGFDVGDIVPVGYYDRDKGVWIASDNGVVVRLLDTSGDGIVDALDTVGDGQPHDTNVAGLTDPAKFMPNDTYWQVKINHFTPWDTNWPYAPPPDAIEPNPQGIAVQDQQQKCDTKDKNGSYCEQKSRILHEDIPIAGTDLSLHYTSDRVLGYKTVVAIPASGPVVPTSLTKIVVQMKVAGRKYEATLPPIANQKTEFIWDGLDHLGNLVKGTVTAEISIGYGYNAFYYSGLTAIARAWATAGGSPTGIRGREDVLIWMKNSARLHRYGSSQFAEGWSLVNHHFLSSSDPNRLYKGDGSTIDNNVSIINTVAGSGGQGYSGDGGPATQAKLNIPGDVTIDSAGNIYIADTRNHRIRKVDTRGVITTVAGNGLPGFSGDGGLATQAKLYYPSLATVDSVGNLFIDDYENHRIRKVDTSGIITTIIGTGQPGFSGDGGLATQAKVYFPDNVTLDKVGNIFFSDLENYRIRKVDTSGIITTVAGTGQKGFSGDGGPATQAMMHYPWGLAVDSSGNIYIGDRQNYRIRKVDTSGIITTFAGNGSYQTSGDGGPAIQAGLFPNSIALDIQGNLYLCGSPGVRRVDTNGIISAIAGNGMSAFSGDGGAAILAGLLCGELVVDGNGKIYVVGGGRVRSISKPPSMVLSGAPGYIFFADENGLGYLLTYTGLHKSTIDLATRHTLLTFNYDSADQLVSFIDGFGNQSTIQRDLIGKPTSITSPDGIVTSLVIDSSNHLIQASYPDGSHYSVDYSSGGLMIDKYDRRGNLFVHDYDINGRIISVLDPEGGNWNYGRTIDIEGNVFSNVLTGEGNLTAYQDKTDSTGVHVSIKTGPSGEMLTTFRSSDSLTETISSTCGMMEKSQYNLDTQYLFKYISAATTTTPAGLNLATAYSRTYQDNNSDQVPDLITDLVSKNSRTWTTTNNILTSVNTSISPNGHTVTSEYDPTTLLTQRINVPGLYPSAFNYDTRGRLISTTTGGRTTAMGYDTNGNIDYIMTPDNKNVDYTYDIMGRLFFEARPDGSTVEYQYDVNGNQTILTNPNEISFGFNYTANNQRRNFVQPLSGTYSYLYDKDRRLKTVTLPSGETITNAYVQGNLSTTTTPEGVKSFNYLCGSRLGSAVLNGESVAFGYDGSLVTSDIRAGILNRVIGYTYNNDFKVTSVSYDGATANLSYDNDGLLTTAGWYTINRNTQNGLPESVTGLGLTLSRSFNGYGELDASVSSVGGAPTYSWSVLTRDNAGRILRREEYVDGSTVTWEYAYNAVGRLIQVRKNGGVVESCRIVF